TSKESAVELINEALRVPLADDEKEELVTALERIGKDSIQARTYASVQRGLSTRSETVDVEGWTKSMSGSQYPAAALDEATVAARLNRLGEIYSKEDDLKGRLELAEAFLASADQKNASGDFGVSRTMIDALYDDARNAALEAEKLGGEGWRVNAVLAAANWRLGDLDEAYRRAEMAVGDLPGNPDGETAMIALGLFAEHRSRQVWKAVRAKQDWPSKWVTDVNAAYAILAKHPFGTADQVVAHCDFLKAFGAAGQADRALDAGLARFPDSPELHERLRGRIFRDGGVDAIEGVYAKMIARDDAHPSLPWFAGYASLVVAEFHRRNGESDAARDAYDRAIVHFEDAIAKNSETQATSDHFIHIAHAGMARVALEKKEWSASLAQIIAAFERNPASSNIPDGLNITAVETAKMLLGALKTNGMDDLAQTLETAMQQLDPALLELRPFERPVGPPRGRDGRPRRQ
ncbi:MAG: hypothetical protein KDB53_11050, partial [Planctomycetes bacterium]|nr:hypothetical protein [Planctomycetota bacterium]